MSLTSKYFLRQSEIRAAEEERGAPSRGGGLAGDFRRRAEINAAWQKAWEDQDREQQYQAHIANSKGEQEYPLMNGL